jgi:hypothetical protein
MAMKLWIRKPLFEKRAQFNFFWSLFKGIVQQDMKWYYTWEEVKERFKRTKTYE